MKSTGLLIVFANLLVACSVPAQSKADVFEKIVSELDNLDTFEITKCTNKDINSLRTICFNESHKSNNAAPTSKGLYKGYSKGMFTIKDFFDGKENWNTDVFDNGWINVPPAPQLHWSQHGNYTLANGPDNVLYRISQSTLNPVQSNPNQHLLDTTKTSKHTLNFYIINDAEK